MVLSREGETKTWRWNKWQQKQYNWQPRNPPWERIYILVYIGISKDPQRRYLQHMRHPCLRMAFRRTRTQSKQKFLIYTLRVGRHTVLWTIATSDSFSLWSFPLHVKLILNSPVFQRRDDQWKARIATYRERRRALHESLLWKADGKWLRWLYKNQALSTLVVPLLSHVRFIQLF